MAVPTIYSPQTVAGIARSVSRQLDDGRWVPCRPEGWLGYCLPTRLRCAWLVFTGRADVLVWEGQP